MKRLYPTKALHRVTEITPELLEAMGVRGLLLDVDDTLSSHGSQTPWPGAVEWAAEMTQKGFRLLILSNNTGKRVAPFAEQFGLPWLSRAAKPLPVGYLRGARRLGASSPPVRRRRGSGVHGYSGSRLVRDAVHPAGPH